MQLSECILGDWHRGRLVEPYFLPGARLDLEPSALEGAVVWKSALDKWLPPALEVTLEPSAGFPGTALPPTAEVMAEVPFALLVASSTEHLEPPEALEQAGALLPAGGFIAEVPA